MKKTNLLLILSLAIISLASCKKSADPGTSKNQDQVYQAKLEELIHLSAHPTSQQDLANCKLPLLNFKTYEDAYNFFKFLEAKEPITHIDRAVSMNAKADSGKTLPVISAVRPTDQFYYNYTFFANPQISTSVSGSFGSESIFLLYQLQYTLSYNPGTVTRNFPSNAIVYYSGFGTASSQRISILAKGQSSNQGIISGGIQVTGSIAGTPYSVFIVITGSYYFTVPLWNDRVYDTMVYTTLSAKAS